MMTGANTSTNRWRYQHARRTAGVARTRGDLPRAGRGSRRRVGPPSAVGWVDIPRRWPGRSTPGAAVSATGRRRRSGAPRWRGDGRGGAAWRRRGRCGTASAPSCAGGVPPRRSARTSPRRAWRRRRASRPSTRRSTGALDVKPAECLRSRRRRRRCRQQRNPRSRPCGPNIAARPAAVDERAVAGHWEVDQIIGAYNRSSMIWLTERQSRYLIPVTMPDGYDADAVLAGLIEGLDTVPAHLRRSLTFDCGSEWANWRRLRPLRPTGVVLRPALAVATRPDREPEPPSALVVPTGHRPPPRHPRPSPTRRKHHQPPAPPQPPPPKPSRTLCCPHRAVTTGTGRRSPQRPRGARLALACPYVEPSRLGSRFRLLADRARLPRCRRAIRSLQSPAGCRRA